MMREAPNRKAIARKLALAVAVLICAASTAPIKAQSPRSGWTGLSLQQALRELGKRGLDVFFTSQVVRPEMLVGSEPTADEPLEILDELLAPHGLTWEGGPGDRLVIVAAAGPSGIRGTVRVRETGRPIAGVRIRVDGTFASSTSDSAGRFELRRVAAGHHSLEAHRPGFVIERLDGVPVFPHRMSEVAFELDASPLTLDEIIVTPSRISLMRDEPVTALDLDRDDILSLPHLGDDIFRALTLLPGVAGEEVSARFNVRGGRSDEVLVLLDRVELFEPYHLRDFSSAISIVAPRALREVNLITGGFPAEYGDRMSGVLDMSTTRAGERRFQLGFGIPNFEAGGSGTFDDGRGHALGTARRGTLELALDIVGQEENPVYWDAFAKLEHQMRPQHRLGLQGLVSEDDLDFIVNEPDVDETYITNYTNSYVWLTHQSIFNESLFVDSVVSVGRVERDRRGIEDDFEEGGFEIRDERRLDVLGFKQDWNAQLGERHYLKWGFDLRDFEAAYDYVNLRELEDPLADVRSEPRTGTTEFQDVLEGEQYSLYLSDRWRVREPLVVELGLRYDEHTLTADRNLSPRANVVYSLGDASLLRFAWGYFYQSQRPYELDVADGETTLAKAERTEQRVIGYERSFDTGHRLLADMLLRVEAYQRFIEDPRVRYENIFEPVSAFPEIEPDRYRIAPERARAHGVEIFLRGRLGRRIDWWAGYTYSRVEDYIRDGLGIGTAPGEARWVPRRIDQSHAFNLDFNFRASEHWDLNLAWRYHTGWPTTTIAGELEEDDEGEVEIVPVLGPVNAERLPIYHRLDLRASREWPTRRGGLIFFVEIQNLYDRGNVAGFDLDFEFEVDENGNVVLNPLEEIWGGIMPSFGVTWEF